MDSIQEKENKVTLRVIDSWRDSLLVIMERDCDSKSCNGITMKMLFNYETKDMAYHCHHHYFCQTHPGNFYNMMWEIQNNLKR